MHLRSKYYGLILSSMFTCSGFAGSNESVDGSEAVDTIKVAASRNRSIYVANGMQPTFVYQKPLIGESLEDDRSAVVSLGTTRKNIREPHMAMWSLTKKVVMQPSLVRSVHDAMTRNFRDVPQQELISELATGKIFSFVISQNALWLVANTGAPGSLRLLISKHTILAGHEKVYFGGEIWLRANELHFNNSSGTYTPPLERVDVVKNLLKGIFSNYRVVPHIHLGESDRFDSGSEMVARLLIPSEEVFDSIVRVAMRKPFTVWGKSSAPRQILFKIAGVEDFRNNYCSYPKLATWFTRRTIIRNGEDGQTFFEKENLERRANGIYRSKRSYRELAQHNQANPEAVAQVHRYEFVAPALGITVFISCSIYSQGSVEDGADGFVQHECEIRYRKKRRSNRASFIAFESLLEMLEDQFGLKKEKSFVDWYQKSHLMSKILAES